MTGFSQRGRIPAKGGLPARWLVPLALAVWSAAVCAFAQAAPPIPQQLVFRPHHASGIYAVGDTVGWTVTPGPDGPAYAYQWTIRRNNAVVLKAGKLDLSKGSDTIEIIGEQPEMLYVALEPIGTDGAFTGGNTGRSTGLYALGAAVAPNRIGLSAPRPADFDAFWIKSRPFWSGFPPAPIRTAIFTAARPAIRTGRRKMPA